MHEGEEVIGFGVLLPTTPYDQGISLLVSELCRSRIKIEAFRQT